MISIKIISLMTNLFNDNSSIFERRNLTSNIKQTNAIDSDSISTVLESKLFNNQSSIFVCANLTSNIKQTNTIDSDSISIDSIIKHHLLYKLNDNSYNDILNYISNLPNYKLFYNNIKLEEHKVNYLKDYNKNKLKSAYKRLNFIKLYNINNDLIEHIFNSKKYI